MADLSHVMEYKKVTNKRSSALRKKDHLAGISLLELPPSMNIREFYKASKPYGPSSL